MTGQANDKHKQAHDQEVSMSKSKNPPTEEQIELLRWTASLGAVTAEALALRLGLSVASARARLSVARRAGLLARERPLTDCPALFGATRAGLRACGARGIDPCRIAAGNARHLSVCAAVAAALERCYPDRRLTGEHELRRDERDAGGPLASAQIGWMHARGSGRHRPDLVLWPSVGAGELPVAVEVELTVKAPRRLLDICHAWARCPSVAGVLYFAPANVERALSRAVERARASERVLVLPLDCLPGLAGAAGTPAEPSNGEFSP